MQLSNWSGDTSICSERIEGFLVMEPDLHRSELNVNRVACLDAFLEVGVTCVANLP